MDRYRGIFCWYGETHVLWTHSTSMAGARMNLFKQLAEKVSYSYPFICSYFAGEKEDYEIKVNNKGEDV